MPTNIIIDTDPGIDDALAIMLAAASPEVRILGITAVAGNTGLAHTAPNAAALVDFCGLDVPVGKGAEKPLWRRDTVPDSSVHGTTGLGTYQLPPSSRPLEPAAELLRRLIDDADGPVTLVAVGPLTNVAIFMNLHPEAARKLERIVIMGGGARDVLGNATAVAEFNIYYDPDAAAKVFDFGVPITMVGLDVTHKALLFMEDYAPLVESGGPVAEAVTQMLAYYGEEKYSGTEVAAGEDAGAAQHDSLAMAAVIMPDIVTTAHLHVDVENVGRITSGMTVVDWRRNAEGTPNCDVAYDVDIDRFRELLVGRLVELDQRLKAR